jgi:hypothetical protein
VALTVRRSASAKQVAEERLTRAERRRRVFFIGEWFLATVIVIITISSSRATDLAGV